MTFARHLKKAGLALVAVSSIGGLQHAWAEGTDAGVTINNRATVTYSVGTVAQTPIESSPTGNATPGVNAGTDTTFVVDRRVFFSVTAIAGATNTVPGATGVVRAFTVANTSNAPIGFRLTSANVAAVVSPQLAFINISKALAAPRPKPLHRQSLNYFLKAILWWQFRNFDATTR